MDRDLAPLYDINSDPDSMRYFSSVMTREQSDAWAGRMQDHIAVHGWGPWVVEEINSPAFLGVVGLSRIEWNVDFAPAVEISWRIHPFFRQMGYASEAAMMSMHHGFKVLGLPEIVAITVPENVPSRRLMERLGMQFRAEFDHPHLAKDHRLSKRLLYGITACQWSSRTA